MTGSATSGDDRLAEIQRMWPRINDAEFEWLVAALVAERAENERLRESREEVFEEFKRYAEAYRAERELADSLAAVVEMYGPHGEALEAHRSARAGLT